MRILVVNADYPAFLRDLYRRHAGLEDADYEEQMAARNATLFGVADFYSRNFSAHGHAAAEIHVNNHWLQYAWAREHGLNLPPPSAPGDEESVSTPNLKSRLKSLARPVLGPLVRPFRVQRLPSWEAQVMAAQVEAFRPDVIINQEITYIDNRTMRPFRLRGIGIVGQLASPLAAREEYDAYHLIISSLPNFVAHFRSKGVPSELNRLAFEPSVLAAMGPATSARHRFVLCRKPVTIA